MLKYALDNQEIASSASDSDLALSFFFHCRGDELQKKPLGLLRSLTHPILSQVRIPLSNLLGYFKRKRHQIGEPGHKWQWHEREVQYYFESSLPKVLEASTDPVWLFVDALDECGKENALKPFRWFKTLHRTLPNTDLQCRICVTCRHSPIWMGIASFRYVPSMKIWETFLLTSKASFLTLVSEHLRSQP